MPGLPVPGLPLLGNDITDGTYGMFPLSSSCTMRANDKAYVYNVVFIPQTTEPMR